MMLKHAGDKERRGMSVEIRREIGNADLIVPIDLAAPQWRWRGQAAVRHPSAGGGGVVFGILPDEGAGAGGEGGLSPALIPRGPRPVPRQPPPPPSKSAGQGANSPPH